MDKRVILAVALSTGILIFWSAVIMPKYTPKTPPVPSTEAQDRFAPASAAKSAPAVKKESPKAKPQKSAQVIRAAQVIPWHGPLADISVDSRGGCLGRYALPGKASSAAVELILPNDRWPGFFCTPGEDFVIKRAGPDRFVAELRRRDGLVMLKTFIFKGDSYIYDIEITLSNNSKVPVEAPPLMTLGPGVGTIATEMKENLSMNRVLAMPESGEGIKKIKQGQQPLPWSWIGIDNRYFLTAIVSPKVRQNVAVDVSTGAHSASKDNDLYPALILSMPEPLPPGETRHFNFGAYVGPKGLQALKRVQWGGRSLGLEESVDYGWFGPIAKFFFWCLLYLKNITGNFGVAIILLTLLLQAALFPLSLKSFRAMKKMKDFSDQINNIRTKFKDDMTRQQQELAEFYKKKGVKPYLGCFIMFLQLPIFVALYNVLRNSFELRGAPFVFWLKDLSEKDPYYVLPIMMGVAMFIQQKMSPGTGDPQQDKMMLIMPVMMTFIFLSFPSGLVLYWLFSNILSLVTQKIVMSKMSEEHAAPQI